MKFILLLIILAALAFFAFDDRSQRQQVGDLQTKVDESTATLATLRLPVSDQIARLTRERDLARADLAAAQAEIARLGGAPKPQTWFDKRIQESEEKINATPPTTSGHRPGM